MTVRLRKIVFQIHMDQLDDDGNITAELSTQEPLTLYPHQLDQFSERVLAVVKQAESKELP